MIRNVCIIVLFSLITNISYAESIKERLRRFRERESVDETQSSPSSSKKVSKSSVGKSDSVECGYQAVNMLDSCTPYRCRNITIKGIKKGKCEIKFAFPRIDCALSQNMRYRIAQELKRELDAGAVNSYTIETNLSGGSAKSEGNSAALLAEAIENGECQALTVSSMTQQPSFKQSPPTKILKPGNKAHKRMYSQEGYDAKIKSKMTEEEYQDAIRKVKERGKKTNMQYQLYPVE